MACVSATEIVCTAPTYWSKFGPKRQKTAKLAQLAEVCITDITEKQQQVFFGGNTERNRKAMQLKRQHPDLPFAPSIVAFGIELKKQRPFSDCSMWGARPPGIGAKI
jgi:hypothetical protein